MSAAVRRNTAVEAAAAPAEEPRRRSRRPAPEGLADKRRIAVLAAPTAARDVPPGQSWAFTDHRSLAEVKRGRPPRPSAAAALAALPEVLAAGKDGVAARLGRALGCGTSTAHGLLAELERAGKLVRGGHRTARFFALAGAAAPEPAAAAPTEPPVAAAPVPEAPPLAPSAPAAEPPARAWAPVTEADRQRVLEAMRALLAEQPGAGAKELALHLGVSAGTANRRLLELEAAGRLRRFPNARIKVKILDGEPAPVPPPMPVATPVVPAAALAPPPATPASAEERRDEDLGRALNSEIVRRLGFGLGAKEPKGCRHIDGDVRAGDWRFCQAAIVAGSERPYCAEHLPDMTVRRPATGKARRHWQDFMGKWR